MKQKCRAQNPETCQYHGNLYTFPTAELNYEEHKKESEKISFLFNAQEKQALTKYLSEEYTPINNHLHNPDQKNIPPHLHETIQSLDTALAKYQTVQQPITTTTFRATKTFIPFKDKTESNQWFAENFAPNKTIILPGFTSTTSNPEALFDFLPEAHEDIHLSPLFNPTHKMTEEEKTEYYTKTFGPNAALSNIIFIITAKPGMPVSSYEQTHAEKEYETLFPRNKKYTVTKVLPHKKVPNPNSSHRRKTAHATIIHLTEQ